MSIFNEDNPFVTPSPEDIDYYGLNVHKVTIDSATPEERAAERDDNYNNQENEND